MIREDGQFLGHYGNLILHASRSKDIPVSEVAQGGVSFGLPVSLEQYPRPAKRRQLQMRQFRFIRVDPLPDAILKRFRGLNVEENVRTTAYKK
jgi:hypothetical protein